EGLIGEPWGSLGCVVAAGGGGVEDAERVEGFDGSIGTEGQGDAQVLHGAIGVGAAVAWPPVAFSDVTVGNGVEGLHRGDDAETLHACEVRGGDELDVFQTIAQMREIAICAA